VRRSRSTRDRSGPEVHVIIAEYAPGATGTSSQPADLAKVVRGDPDLLALEFNVLMAANYPDLADRPAPRPPHGIARLLTRRLPLTRPSLPVRREPPPFADEQADEDVPGPGQRAPPCHPAGRPSAEEVMLHRR
jgi:hypothetical protein